MYRRFVSSLARAAALLSIQTGKTKPFEFELIFAELNTFEELKELRVSTPILALLLHRQWYTPDTDACAYQILLDLLQPQPNGDKLTVEHWSRGLSAPEKSYSNTENECLAMVGSVLTLRLYLHRDNFALRPDHHVLSWVLNLADSSGRLAR